ncbi:SusC/RagA family TonB-linked outer membrane protein [Spirosoma flavum]|uniref:SusC/RagA family TonB-linked outer membrane protein n=1 Tax=Spirosoma flavum TaxID=2048557 RepID=A0ABW6ABX7_9BACT
MSQLLRAVLFFLLLHCVFLSPSAASAQTFAANYARPVFQGEVNPSTRLSLNEALDVLSKQHQVIFEFNDNLLKNKTVDRSIIDSKKSLKEKLGRILTPFGLNFERYGKKSYIIFPPANASRSSSELKEKELLKASANNNSAYNPLEPKAGRDSFLKLGDMQVNSVPVADISIQGTVSDEKGETLPGVSIVLKGSQRGTTTDAQGHYKMDVPNVDGTLIFSFVGYLSQEVSVGNRVTLDVVLKADNKTLDEIVVVGYGTVKRKDLTGAVGSVNTQEIKELAVARIDQALLGKVAGVQVKTVSGDPGAAPQIKIRGIGSISAGSNPLYVVDGFPIDNIQTLNPNDVESMDVLKDASATAIYGSRGANGVIIINTKRGKTGKAVINFDTYYGSQSVMKRPEFLNANQQAQYYYDGVRNRNIDNGNNISGAAGSWTVPVPQTVLDVLSGKNTLNTDALGAVLRNAPQRQYQLSASGGSENVKYALSGEYFNQEGIILNSNFNRYSIRANIDAKLTNRLSVRFNFNTAYTEAKVVTASGPGGGDNDGIIAQATSAQPYYPLYNADGSYFVYSNIDASTILLNPVALAQEIQAKRKGMRVLGNVNLAYKLTDALTLNILLGATSYNSRGSRFRPQIPAFFNNAAVGADSSSNTLNWLTEYTLNYQKSFGKHNVTGLAGFTAQKETTESSFLTSNRYPNNLVPTLSAVSGILTDGSSNRYQWSLISYLARVNYNYSDKYYLTASIRTDGSSRFGSNNKYGVFPSLALAWRISDENFLKSIPSVSELKLRVSYGETGNNNIGNYDHLATINYEKYTLGGVAIGGYAPSRLANPNLTWEKQKSFNMGIDASFFNRRLGINIDHFEARNTDLLLNVNVPDITGFSTALQNIGEVKNTGWEFVVSTLNLQNKLVWSTDFNVSTYKNKVVKLGAQGDPIISGRNITMIGQPIGMFYGYLTDGIFKSQADVDRGPIYNPGATDRSRPGDIRFVDVSGPNGTPDGIINNYDNTIIGTPYPTFYYGMTNRFAYKSISLSVSLQGSYGSEVISTARNITLLTRSRSRTLSSQANYWKSEQDPGDGVTPRPNDAPTGGIRLANQRYVDTGTYLRINNVTLSYQLPSELVKKLTLSSIRVYASATNPFILTKNTSFNPDVSSSGDALTPGIDLNNYPLAKSFLLGLNVSF